MTVPTWLAFSMSSSSIGFRLQALGVFDFFFCYLQGPMTSSNLVHQVFHDYMFHLVTGQHVWEAGEVKQIFTLTILFL
jgi:hypothetical protein